MLDGLGELLGVAGVCRLSRRGEHQASLYRAKVPAPYPGQVAAESASAGRVADFLEHVAGMRQDALKAIMGHDRGEGVHCRHRCTSRGSRLSSGISSLPA